MKIRANPSEIKNSEVQNMNPFEELANAIVIQAAKDYMKALKKLKKYPRDAEARQMRNDCESFFRSSWYSTLTSVDGELLMRKLQMEVAA